MQRPWLSLAIVLSLAITAHAEKARKPKPALPAGQYQLHQTNAEDHVTVAAEPGDVDATRPDTRLDYFHHGFLPVRVIITNDSDQPLDLDQVRIHFIGADNSVIPAATEDELIRGLFTLKSATGTKLPLGLPIPITVGKKDIEKKVAQDDIDFGFATTTVAPHSTIAGYLFYDVRDLDDPALRNATLEVRKMEVSGTHRVIDSFEIPLRPSEAASVR
ncbi:MAG: hypothetical protein V4555_04465 [Acidobacteriota bacterium]